MCVSSVNVHISARGSTTVNARISKIRSGIRLDDKNGIEGSVGFQHPAVVHQDR